MPLSYGVGFLILVVGFGVLFFFFVAFCILIVVFFGWLVLLF